MKNWVKSRMTNINKLHILLLVIMLLSSMLLIYLTTQKEGMHVDEYATYALANNATAKNNNLIHLKYGVRLAATDIYDQYFYADHFSIRNVWHNQAINVHPPLYYLFFHIFTLCTNHFLGLKTGILLNIIIHMINIWLIWLVIKEMIHNEYEAFLGTTLYAFLPVVLDNVLFIRMYVLLTTFILVLTLLFVKEWDKPEGKKFYIKLAVVSVFGTLTHYYFLIYLFYCCVVWGIRIICKRRWKELFTFLAAMTAAGVLSLAIFPHILRHIFSGNAGKMTMDNVASSAFSLNVGAFTEAIDNAYGGFLLAVIVVAAALLSFSYVYGNKSEEGQGVLTSRRWLIIIIPCVLYFFTVTWIAIFVATRYISPLYAICVILMMGLLEKVISCFNFKDYARCVVVMVLLGLLLNNSWKIYTWPGLYKEAKEPIEISQKYGINNECIFVVNVVNFHTKACYQEFIQYQNITFIPYLEMELLYNEEYEGYDHVVMYFDKNLGQGVIDEILADMIGMNPGLDEYTRLYEYNNNVAYYLE